MFSIFKKKDNALEISEGLLKRDFLRTVKHYVAFPTNGKTPFSFAILPLVEGILTSISMEDFHTAQDEEGRIIFTHVDKAAQIVVDYNTQLMTVSFGYILFDTYEIPQNQPSDYHR